MRGFHARIPRAAILPPVHPQTTDLHERFAARDADWRAGAVVYQVFVDRFAQSDDLNAKLHLYPEPKRLRHWHENPSKGHFVESAGVWSHEIDFWKRLGEFVTLALGHATRNDQARSVEFAVGHLENGFNRLFTRRFDKGAWLAD